MTANPVHHRRTKHIGSTSTLFARRSPWGKSVFSMYLPPISSRTSWPKGYLYSCSPTLDPAFASGILPLRLRAGIRICIGIHCIHCIYYIYSL
jgi:hypothetical protein